MEARILDKTKKAFCLVAVLAIIGLVFGSAVSTANKNGSCSDQLITNNQAVSSFPVGGIAMFTGPPPSGWTRFTALDGRFPRGSPTYGGTGGSTEHSHSFSGTTDEDFTTGHVSSGWRVAPNWPMPHYHHFSGTTDPASNLPPYLDVIFCQKGEGAPDAFPVGGIALFTGPPPSGWTRLTALDGRFPKGSPAYGGTGGAIEHSHSFSGTTGEDFTTGHVSSGWRVAPNWPMPHYHHFSGTTDPASNLPPYLDVIFCQKGEGAPDAFPVGGIALSTGPPPSGWTRFTALDGRFPRGSPTYGGIGGATEHSHSFSGTTGEDFTTGHVSSGWRLAPNQPMPHYHHFSGTTDLASNLPPYLDIVFAQKEKTLPPDLIVDDIWIEPDPPTAGGSTKIWFRIKNQGTGDAIETFFLEFYFDGTYVGHVYKYGLTAGSTSTSYWWRTWPSDTNQHTIIGVVDPDNTVSESNEGNNQRLEYFSVPVPCNCGDICVNETGWWRDGGTFNPSGTPIQDAIDNATAGETICVKDGTYNENVEVNKGVTIISENGADSTIVQAADPNDPVFEVTADFVDIIGFTAEDAVGDGIAGIFLDEVDHCNISDNHALNSYYGISLYSSSNCIITNNVANSNADCGINVGDSQYCEVYGNTVSFNDDRGIVFEEGGNNYAYNNIVHNNSAYGAIEAIDSDNNTIYNNTAYYNCWAIATNGGSNNLIHNNTIYENDIGVYLDWPSTGNRVLNNDISYNRKGIFTNHNSTDNIINDNWVFSNEKTGLVIRTNNNVICSNAVTSNGDGILLSSASNNIITDNNALNNGNGICLLESSDNNTIINNIANSNTWSGIWIFGSLNNNITENTANLNNGSGIALEAISKHNIISKNTANSNNHNGILVRANSGHHSATHPWGPSDNNIISGNTADTNSGSGIYLLEGSSNNILLGNNANSNSFGISLSTSCNNTLKNNVMNNNRYNFGFFRQLLFNDISHFYHDIDTSNMVDGKPIYYWIERENQQVPGDAGFVGIVNSTNITVRDLRLTNNSQGVSVVFSNDSIIEDVYVSNNFRGIVLCSSCNNTLTGINASSNYWGIRLGNSNSNLIYNNYFENTFNAGDDGNNIWNISKTAETNIIGGSWLGGNYWSDYAGEDLDGDGLGDTLIPYNPYGDITNGGDWHPLVESAISLPDLVIHEKWVCWPENCRICYNVTNIGNGTAPACHNTTLYVDGTAVAHDHVPVDLATGESYIGCFDGYDWGYTPPSDNITVCADNNETLDELNETNNCRTNIWMCGDVNGDGEVTMSDVRKVFNRYLDPNYPLDSPWAADVNCNGKVTMSDVRKVFNRYLDPGYELKCCCEGVG